MVDWYYHEKVDGVIDKRCVIEGKKKDGKKAFELKEKDK